MKLKLEKFGKTLISRELGSEALKAFQQTLRELSQSEQLEIDFSGVLTLSPSWGDEFLSPLLNQLGDRLVLLPSDNLSVQETLKIIHNLYSITSGFHSAIGRSAKNRASPCNSGRLFWSAISSKAPFGQIITHNLGIKAEKSFA